MHSLRVLPVGLDRRSIRVLALSGIATLLASFDGSVVVLALPAVAADFHASVPDLSELGSVLSLGALAALPLAMLADRAGRRRVLAAAVAGFSLANLGSAVAPTLSSLAAARLLAVAFETVAFSVATAIAVEQVGAGARGVAVAVVTLTAGAGTGLTTLLYPLAAPAWRLLYVAGAAGLLAVPVLLRMLPESEAWARARPERLPLRVLLVRPWRSRLGLAALAGALAALLFEPAGLFVALYGSRTLRLSPAEISAIVVVSGLAAAPAFLVGGRLSDRAGRRRVAVLLSSVTAACAALTFAGGRGGYWAGSILWSVFASAAVPVLGAWYGELFPTRARATSESVSAIATAVGGIAGLQLVARTEPIVGLGYSVVGAAGAAVLGAWLLLFLPETRDQPLPE